MRAVPTCVLPRLSLTSGWAGGGAAVVGGGRGGAGGVGGGGAARVGARPAGPGSSVRAVGGRGGGAGRHSRAGPRRGGLAGVATRLWRAGNRPRRAAIWTAMAARRAERVHESQLARIFRSMWTRRRAVPCGWPPSAGWGLAAVRHAARARVDRRRVGRTRCARHTKLRTC